MALCCSVSFLGFTSVLSLYCMFRTSCELCMSDSLKGWPTVRAEKWKITWSCFMYLKHRITGFTSRMFQRLCLYSICYFQMCVTLPCFPNMVIWVNFDIQVTCLYWSVHSHWWCSNNTIIIFFLQKRKHDVTLVHTLFVISAVRPIQAAFNLSGYENFDFFPPRFLMKSRTFFHCWQRRHWVRRRMKLLTTWRNLKPWSRICLIASKQG